VLEDWLVKGYPKSLSRLIEQLEKFPGIGRKTAERLAFHILKVPSEEAMGLAYALRDLKKNTVMCSQCCNIDETDPCWVCSDPARDRSVICVVEQTHDLLALERSQSYKGLYHVLGGHISPLDGITPQNLTIDKLLGRITGDVKEVVLATNPNMEGDVTANHIAELLKPLGVKVTRPARGLPPGSQVESVSQAILTDAMKGRQQIS
jgi:recombination protein RecR